MFNSGIKGNQRCNGFNSTSHSLDQICNSNKTIFHMNYNYKSKLANRETYNNGKHRNRKNVKDSSIISNSLIQDNCSDVKIKLESNDLEFENNITAHSIIGLGDLNIKSETHNAPTIVKPRFKRGNIRATHHEVLQRIEVENDYQNHYQQHWFSASLEKFKLEDRSREERIEITRHEFRRHIQQLVRSNVGKPSKSWIDLEEKFTSNCVVLPVAAKTKHQRGYGRLVEPRICEVEKCQRPALPCARHCAPHIMRNADQVLFEYCTAKFADNTHCRTPVFDVAHELPLCAEHARKRDNYKLYQEAKPKKLRRKVKSSAMIRPQKRSKKKRKPLTNKGNELTITSAISTIPSESSPGSVEEVCEIIEAESTELEDMQMVDQVLGLNENGLDQALVTQAQLLEETDINTVLSTIQVDEFSDLFAVNRNGEYEPSREETEELEKALAAVDNDVKSLEKLTRTHGLLDPFLTDENALAETLVQQLPEVFHGNGYAQTASFLLPVEPHSQS